jgi:hypothetical protein
MIQNETEFSILKSKNQLNAVRRETIKIKRHTAPEAVSNEAANRPEEAKFGCQGNEE